MIRLASYNIRKAVGLDWRRDPARILRVIRGLGADIVALQEADKRLGERPAALSPDAIARETGLLALDVAPMRPSLGFHGNALLVGEEVEVEQVLTVTLPGIEPRGAVIARLVTGDGPLTVAAVHLGLRRGCRQLQLAHIRDLIARDRPVAILGDLNEWSAFAGFDVLGPDFAMIRPGRSFHAARPVACLDRFVLGGGIRLQHAGVVRDGDAARASDHLPVWADVTLEEAGPDR